MRIRSEDLTGYARIRHAALEGFAMRGVSGTSMRDIAARAGVSLGLVQHHFDTKAALRAVVDEYVVSSIAEVFGRFGSVAPGSGRIEEIGNLVAVAVRDHHLAFRYIGRLCVESDPAGLDMFDALARLAEGFLAPMAEAGLLRPDVDLTRAAFNGVMIAFATVLFEPVLSRRLSAPLFDDAAELAHWNRTCTGIFEHGVLAEAPVPRAVRRGPKPR